MDTKVKDITKQEEEKGKVMGKGTVRKDGIKKEDTEKADRTIRKKNMKEKEIVEDTEEENQIFTMLEEIIHELKERTY